MRTCIAFLLPGWSTMVVVALRRVDLWLLGWEVRGGFGVHYPIGRSFGLAADGDGEFLLFGDVVPVGNDSFGRDVLQVVAFDVCVSSDFVQYCGQS